MYTPATNFIPDFFHNEVSCEEYYEFSRSYRYNKDSDFLSWEDYDKRDNFEEEYSERRY